VQINAFMFLDQDLRNVRMLLGFCVDVNKFLLFNEIMGLGCLFEILKGLKSCVMTPGIQLLWCDMSWT